MDLAAILADDWEVMDDVRTVSYLSRTGPSTFATAVSVTDALRRASKKDDQHVAWGSALLAIRRVAWHLWTAKLGSVVPKTTDVILEADGTRWTVTEVEIMDEGQRWRLECLKER